MVVLNSPSLNSILQEEINSLQRTKNWVVSILNTIPLIYKTILLNYSLKKLNTRILLFSLTIKGLRSEAVSKIDNNEKYQFKDVITKLSEILNYNIKFKESFSKFESVAKGYSSYPYFKKINNNLSEVIDNLYDTILILKKANKRQSIETSNLAKSISKKSLLSLQKVFESD
ncbi:MAG: hypothetical protein ABI237_03210 [Ginsengibacter sp.]